MTIEEFFNILDKSKLEKNVIVMDTKETVNYCKPGDVVVRISIIKHYITNPDNTKDVFISIKEDGFKGEIKKLSTLIPDNLNSIIQRIYNSDIITEDIYHSKIRSFYDTFLNVIKTIPDKNLQTSITESDNEITLQVGLYPIFIISKDFDVSRAKFDRYVYDKDYENPGELLSEKRTDSCVGMNDKEMEEYILKYVNRFLNGPQPNFN